MQRHDRVYLVADMTDVIRDNVKRRSLYGLFTKFTLHEMIESILSVDPFIDYSNFVWDILETKIAEDDAAFDRDLFQLFYEGLMEEVDEAIKEQYKREFEDIGNRCYLFVKWVDKTSLLLRLE